MKKVLISITCTLLIVMAIFVSLFIVPQFVGGEYSIGTMPNKLEYHLVTSVDESGKTHRVMEGKWDTTGLEVIKTNKMGQARTVEPKDYTIVFPSYAEGAGDYNIIVSIIDTKIELLIPIKLVLV